jgi:hypothetical protein
MRTFRLTFSETMASGKSVEAVNEWLQETMAHGNTGLLVKADKISW